MSVSMRCRAVSSSSKMERNVWSAAHMRTSSRMRYTCSVQISMLGAYGSMPRRLP